MDLTLLLGEFEKAPEVIYSGTLKIAPRELRILTTAGRFAKWIEPFLSTDVIIKNKQKALTN